ncbi:ABC-type uncharacterized transport system [Geminocystis sp. NIES-3708]|uniref:hypothetical protein n=1 Tax=Geminocystis sp. NIES-3708 TaxID=1615909 RepID=UPI0005FC631D|nr:hypothetical protein [Geminocystis sp. NIES-3708]BAQ62669.1 ABC-type uncharacterized transport system [Geminocystis sp. NIES-3708]
MNYFSTVIILLSDRQNFLEEIYDGVNLKSKISSLMFSSFCFFAIYGAIIGTFHSPLQALSSAIKLPALYLITLLICLPTLYIFNVLFGSKQNIAQHFTYLLTAVTVIAVLLCGFAPVVLFFLITVNDYPFFVLLNVVIFALTGIIGVSFLYRIMKPIDNDDNDQNIKVRKNILKFWLVLYGFVGSQLGWTLRPFFGTAGNFEFFRPREGSFFSGVLNAFIDFVF